MSIDPRQYLQLRQVTKGFQNVKASLGLYPLNLDEEGIALSEFMDLVPDVLYLGEVGLDFSEGAPRQDLQKNSLKQILSKAEELGGRIVSLHSRRAGDEMLRLLREFFKGALILHWFSGGTEQLKNIGDNVYFSINTAMLRSRNGRTLIENCPKEKVLLESDGPYVDSGGNPVFPWELKSVVEALSSRWKTSVEEVLDQLNENLSRVDESISGVSLRQSSF